MTVFEVPNIEHCTVTPMANGMAYRIVTNDGWVIKLPDYAENEYSTAVILMANRDYSTLQILPISSLPEDAVINGETNKPEIV